MSGQLVAEKAITELTNTLDISSISAGSYLLNIVKDGNIQDHKIVIIR